MGEEDDQHPEEVRDHARWAAVNALLNRIIIFSLKFLMLVDVLSSL